MATSIFLNIFCEAKINANRLIRINADFIVNRYTVSPPVSSIVQRLTILKNHRQHITKQATKTYNDKLII
ncbi:MAG: hypothetical protein ABIL66_11050 [candidate division WOR-3 bacterium]